MDMEDHKAYLNIDELSRRAGLSLATLWRLKRAGKIPFSNLGAKAIAFASLWML
jgi:predicted DNA-binding transcriptional regulator AlpA